MGSCKRADSKYVKCIFDLKGSRVKRDVKLKDCEGGDCIKNKAHKNSCTLKDTNLIFMKK